MTGQYIVQGIFALAGITSLLASLLNWNWFFTTRNAQTIVKNQFQLQMAASKDKSPTSTNKACMK